MEKFLRSYNNYGMRLISEIFKAVSAEAGARVEYTVVDGQGGYFQNVKRIVEFSPNQIVLRGKKDLLKVGGTELKIGKYYAGDVYVRGNIERVEREV